MRLKPTVIIMLIMLTSIGAWGLWKIIVSSDFSLTSLTTGTNSNPSFQQNTQNLNTNTSISQRLSSANEGEGSFVWLFRQVKQQLSQENHAQAIEAVNEQYSQLSSDQLAAFKQLFIRQGQNYSDNGLHNKALRLFSELTTLFDEVDVLDMLSHTAVKLKDWQVALEALLSSSLLESQPESLIKKQAALANIAAQLKLSYQASEDFVSVQQLYQQLYEAHPGYAYFQYELGLAQLSLDDTINAKSLFSAIQYDLDIGPAAREQLALIERQESEQRDTVNQQKQPKTTDIVVPLTRVGNSFLVSSTINGRQTRLLLDTGASITALSPEIINHLSLPATGDIIRLSTANGITEARLYLAKRIQLGRVIARDLVVAEVELGNTDRFQGLLGTDLLNQINENYLIDNQNNNLIFRSGSR